MSALPLDCIWGQDNVNVSALTPGFQVYGGYYNGPYANMTALRARFPHARLLSIATRLYNSKGADVVDVEPGTLATSQSANFAACLAWLRQGGHTGVPIVYCMASWAQALVNYLAANGFARKSYYLFTAHYNGQHLCGSGCNYLSGTVADATQYATGANDYDVFRGYVVKPGGVPAPTPVPSPALGGVTVPGLSISTVQAQLNTWAAYCGFGKLVVDGVYGAKTYQAVRTFQAKRKLQVDGVVGVVTEKNLVNPPGVIQKIKPKPAPPKPVVPSGIPVLKLGSHGNQVAAVQYYLRNSHIPGVRGIDADGNFGVQTQTAVKNFQAHAHLPNDGVYGPATAKALSKVAVA